MEYKMRILWREWKEEGGHRDSCSGRNTKRRRSKTIHQMYKKEMKRTKCFHIFLPFIPLSPIHLFIQPCFSIHSVSRQKKKKRTHKTPIHKIKPIPSLSWANCLLEVCWRFCVDKIVYFFHYFVLLLPHVLQETISNSHPFQPPRCPILLRRNVLFQQWIAFSKHNHKANGHLHHSPVGKHYFSSALNEWKMREKICGF